jgi:hypothetical protein
MSPPAATLTKMESELKVAAAALVRARLEGATGLLARLERAKQP